MAWVIRNRVEHNGLTYQRTVTFNQERTYHFTCWNPKDVNYDYVMNPFGKQWQISQDVAKGVLDGSIPRPDELGNVRHYYSPEAMVPSGSRPKWSSE